MTIELMLCSGTPRKNPGIYTTRNHYQNHIYSLNIWPGFGYKIELTLMKSDKFGFRLFKHHNYS